MRVLCMQENGNLEALAVVDMRYDDDITGIKDDDGTYVRYAETCITGLYMELSSGDEAYIPDVPPATCNAVCREIYCQGYCDLSTIGAFVWL